MSHKHKILTFVAELRDPGANWWWDWKVRDSSGTKIPHEEWSEDEIRELLADAWWFYTDKRNWREQEGFWVSYTFTREGMSCNLVGLRTVKVGVYR